MNDKQKTFLSIKQTADYLGVSKKSLMRWDKEDYFSSRETITRARVYYIEDVKMAKRWLDLREKHRKHLARLPEIQKALGKVLVAHPLIPVIPGEPVKFRRVEDMKAPFEAMEKWEEQEREIMKEYLLFDDWNYRKIERNE